MGPPGGQANLKLKTWSRNMIINKQEKKSSFKGSVLILMIMVIIFGVCIIKYKFEAHVPISMCIGMLIIYGCTTLGIKWKDMSASIINSVSPSLECMLIILMIGATVGTWIAAGTVPYLITLGLKFMTGSHFLVSALCVCAVMSMCTGSSWTTMGTIGVAFMGVGAGLGVDPAMAAGAIVCGAYLGDTQSPLSDQTNFSSSVAKADLYTHLKSMMYTTVPAFGVCIIAFYILGMKNGGDADMSAIENMVGILEEEFNFTPVLLLPFVLMFVMVLLKIPAFPTLLICSCTGILFSVIFQGADILDAGTYWYSGFVGATGDETVDFLLTRGGITSMWYTLTLMILSLTLAGLLERCGIISNLVGGMYSLIHGILSLTVVQLIAGYVLSFIASDPYLAMLLPANAFAEKYDEFGYDRTVLSRTLENGATIVAPMVPWGSNGVYCAAALGVATIQYIPYYFMGIITPFICILCCVTGFGMLKKNGDDKIKPGKTRKKENYDLKLAAEE